MSFINITALTVPAGAGEEIERRFSALSRAVDGAAGFESFELLRPVFGEERYFVVTRWADRESYEAWKANRTGGDYAGDRARGMSVELMGFDVVQHDEA